ncbi:helix-turn-helix domain-containing protein [Croceiramulus getboli]|nr:helix-turn-helix domain-containing protein [Flavobacteriaceae bacterium YJPT1-3]
MKHQFQEFQTDAILKIGDEELLLPYRSKSSWNGNSSTKLDFYTFIWTQEKNVRIQVDSVPEVIAPQTIVALTPLQYLEYESHEEDLIVYQFNREFYCIKDHDREVSCTGLLFFGNEQVPKITLSKEEQHKFTMLHQVLLDELETDDTIQGEMLRMLVKRFIIKTTRLLKNQQPDEIANTPKMDLVRAYNMLVEEHYKNKHEVSAYADLLFKSAKTLSNSFAAYSRSPLQIIHDRIVLEAKRQLAYTDRTAKEIAFDLGFDDPSHFSRLFKRNTGSSPTAFKASLSQLPGE